MLTVQGPISAALNRACSELANPSCNVDNTAERLNAKIALESSQRPRNTRTHDPVVVLAKRRELPTAALEPERLPAFQGKN